MKTLHLSIILAVVIIGIGLVDVMFIIQTHPEILATKPSFISKQQAIDIVMNKTHCEGKEILLGVDASLYHIKNDTVLVVNDTNMQDEFYISRHYLPEKIGLSDYVWKASLACYYDHNVLEYTRFIDAKSGILLK